jgi:hypothetical protein
VLVRVARWDALGSALKEDVRVRLAVSTMALPGDTPYAPGAGAIRRFEIDLAIDDCRAAVIRNYWLASTPPKVGQTKSGFG